MTVRAGGRSDAVKTADAARRFGARWVVVDGYHFGPGYREILQKSGFRVLWVDDLGSSENCFSDIVVNQNLHAKPNLYPRREARPRLMLGSRYALLRNEFSAFQRRSARHSTVKRILVSGGGTDPKNITRTVLKALANVPAPRFEIDVLLGGGYRKAWSLAGWARRAGVHRVHVHKNPRNIAFLMSRADLGILAAGSTCLEIARLGLPAILVAQSDNQTNIAHSMHQEGAAWSLGSIASLSVGEIRDRVEWLARSPSVRKRMSLRGKRLVDGKGAKRVVAMMQDMASPRVPFVLRRVRPSDCRRLWNWANDPAARAASFSETRIPWGPHQAWFKERLNNSHCVIFVAVLRQGKSIGSARFERRKIGWVISVFVERTYRGQGLGSSLIRTAACAFMRDTGEKVVNAYVKPTNGASLQAFLRAGFRQRAKTRISNTPAYWCVLTTEDCQ
ncbi:MAG: UDP-2,4-diacetamido-2,4,6-trideoxy-beta-L-altropyranose hydrolase [Elusimicrobia bacterium]|nr:UDP-2,4-diacetamido-2,4,6-trideoxy-beta-L-altropyranose hydrolase [Elusimicrobiota bacterium]